METLMKLRARGKERGSEEMRDECADKHSVQSRDHLIGPKHGGIDNHALPGWQ
jgi:hypothetical protein